MSTEQKTGHAMGVAMKRKEDPRFLQGKGHYVDDITLPGMLYMALVRSTYPHATIKSIDDRRRAEGAGREGGDHRQGPRGCRPRVAADVSRTRQADGAGHRQGAVPVPGSRGRVRGNARRGRTTAPRRCRWITTPLPVVADPFTAKTDKVILRPDREKKTNHIYHWEVGDRDKTATALAVEPEARQAAHVVPALPSGAARAVRLRGAVRHDGTAAVPRDVAGAARLSHGARARHRHSRGQDPRHLAGHRRRLRQQGAGLSRVRLRHRRRAQARPAGQVDRDADGEPDEHRLRARLPHGRRDGREGGRHAHCDQRGDDCRPWRVRRGGGSRRNIPPACSASSRAATRCPSRTPRWTRTSRTRRRAGSPTAARSASPRRASRSSARWTSWPTSSAWTPSSCAGRTSSGRISSPTPRRSGSPTTAATMRKTLDKALEKIGYQDLLKEQAEKREAGAN